LLGYVAVTRWFAFWFLLARCLLIYVPLRFCGYSVLLCITCCSSPAVRFALYLPLPFTFVIHHRLVNVARWLVAFSVTVQRFTDAILLRLPFGAFSPFYVHFARMTPTLFVAFPIYGWLRFVGLRLFICVVPFCATFAFVVRYALLRRFKFHPAFAFCISRRHPGSVCVCVRFALFVFWIRLRALTVWCVVITLPLTFCLGSILFRSVGRYYGYILRSRLVYLLVHVMRIVWRSTVVVVCVCCLLRTLRFTLRCYAFARLVVHFVPLLFHVAYCTFAVYVAFSVVLYADLIVCVDCCVFRSYSAAFARFRLLPRFVKARGFAFVIVAFTCHTFAFPRAHVFVQLLFYDYHVRCCVTNTCRQLRCFGVLRYHALRFCRFPSSRVALFTLPFSAPFAVLFLRLIYRGSFHTTCAFFLLYFLPVHRHYGCVVVLRLRFPGCAFCVALLR